MDIEASIQKEMALLSERKREPKLFSPVHINAPCVLFFKTRDPIDPADFVHRICEEVVSKPGIRRLKYVNRLTPMTLMGRATESGLAEVGNAVLSKYFQLSGVDAKAVDGTDQSTAFSVSQPLELCEVFPLLKVYHVVHGMNLLTIGGVCNSANNTHAQNASTRCSDQAGCCYGGRESQSESH